MPEEWCRTCCTQHAKDCCPGELRATGPERRGIRIEAETPFGKQEYGVLLAPSHDAWRARIVTLPKTLWSVPGGGRPIKFVGWSPEEAQNKAVAFVESYCERRGFRRRETGDRPAAPQPASRPRNGPFPLAGRKHCSLPVRFGAGRRSALGMTLNASESGVFIGTASPLEAGAPAQIHLFLDGDAVRLRGVVMWSRSRPERGRPPGMGVRLLQPPEPYERFVKTLR